MPGTTETITGRERIGWDQQAADAIRLAALRYALYVDGLRYELTETACTETAGPSGFACSGQLPSLTTGLHTLELAAFITAVDVVESPRSAPIRVVVNASTLATSATGWRSGHIEIETTTDGIHLGLERIAGALEEPIDAAVAPDGRLFVAERAGRVRIADSTGLQSPAALTTNAEEDGLDPILSLAIDPDFARTGFVFIVQAARSAAGAVVRLERYRELRGTLAQRAVLLETPITSVAEAAAVLRVGPDRRLYLALHGGPSEGTLLRLNLDGTMPRDQAGTTPAIAGGLQIPRGMAWDARAGIMWIADETDSAGHLSGITIAGPPLRAVVRARHPLGASSGSLAFYDSDVLPGLKGDALLASAQERHLLRIRFAAGDPGRVASTEALLQDRVGAVRVVTVGPDGAIYFCTDDSVGRLRSADRDR